MRSRLAALLGLLAIAFCVAAQPAAQPKLYYPDSSNWMHVEPVEMGVDSAKLGEAIDFAKANESHYPRSLLLTHLQTFGREPFGDPVGPFQDRGPPTGVIVYHGILLRQWGDPGRVDMTFSVSKSFLSSVVGVAYDRGMIRSLDDPVSYYVGPIVPWHPPGAGDKSDRVAGDDQIRLFDTPNNRLIRWDDMLRQTSDWEGTLWGKPDWADRPGPPGEWLTRKRNPPGTSYKYNDTRVNVLALAALQVWRRPLPQVLRETIMDPIGASNTWRWYGYENSWIVLDGQIVQSVSGGGHWGGGMFINAYDMARFGLLTLRHGRWNGKQLLSDKWVDMALTPTPVEPSYGFMNWFNNRDGKLFPSAPRSAFAHIGAGTNIIYVDPDHDLVAVVRWIENDKVDGFIKLLLASFR